MKLYKKKVEKYLTIYLQCPTLHDHKTTLALQCNSIFSPLYFGRRCSSCSTRKHCHAPFGEGLICRPNLNDGGWNVIHRYDLNTEDREGGKEEWLIWINIGFVGLEFCFHFGKRENIWVAMSSLPYQFVYLDWINAEVLSRNFGGENNKIRSYLFNVERRAKDYLWTNILSRKQL